MTMSTRFRTEFSEWIGLVAEPGTRAFYEPLGFRALAGHEPMLHGGETDGR